MEVLLYYLLQSLPRIGNIIVISYLFRLPSGIIRAVFGPAHERIEMETNFIYKRNIEYSEANIIDGFSVQTSAHKCRHVTAMTKSTSKAALEMSNLYSNPVVVYRMCAVDFI